MAGENTRHYIDWGFSRTHFGLGLFFQRRRASSGKFWTFWAQLGPWFFELEWWN